MKLLCHSVRVQQRKTTTPVHQQRATIYLFFCFFTTIVLYRITLVLIQPTQIYLTGKMIPIESQLLLLLLLQPPTEKKYRIPLASVSTTVPPPFLIRSTSTSNSSHTIVPTGRSSPDIWQQLQQSQRKNSTLYYYSNMTAHLTSEYICQMETEWDGGPDIYQLLTKRIQVASRLTRNNTTDTKSQPILTGSTSTARSPPIKLVCAIYTHSRMHNLAVVAALTWGQDCDQFVLFTNATYNNTMDNNNWMNETFVLLSHDGPESYHNMWQKTRSIWKYLYEHFGDEYDWFHLSGDDVFVIVPNLRQMLITAATTRNRSSTTGKNDSIPWMAGQWIRQKKRPYIGGGPGYTLNRAALIRYMSIWDTCYPHTVASYEDRLLSQCLASVGVEWLDTRNSFGEQRYHDTGPQQVYQEGMPQSHRARRRRRRPNFHSRAVSYWETLPYPNASSTIPAWNITNNTANLKVVGPKYGYHTAANDTISFHKIHHPVYMARMYALVYPNTCPTSSPIETFRRPNDRAMQFNKISN